MGAVPSLPRHPQSQVDLKILKRGPERGPNFDDEKGEPKIRSFQNCSQELIYGLQMIRAAILLRSQV